MKRILYLVPAFLFLLAFSAQAFLAPTNPPAAIGLAWDPSPDTVAGYNIYVGVASRAYTNKVNCGSATNTTISGLVRGVTYYFTATAYDAYGLESDFSNEVSYQVPKIPSPPVLKQPTLKIAAAPVGNMIQGEGDPLVAYSIEAVPVLGSLSWEPLGTTTADGTGEFVFFDAEAAWLSSRFYRAESQ